MTKKSGKGWKEELATALQDHRIAKSQATEVAFALLYGTETIIPIDLVGPAVKLSEIAGIPREDTLEIVEEMREKIASHNCLYQANMKARHEGQFRERKFQVGELVWKATPHVQGVVGAVKYMFSPKWEGAHSTGHYWLKDQAGIKANSPISRAHLQKYHA